MICLRTTLLIFVCFALYSLEVNAQSQATLTLTDKLKVQTSTSTPLIKLRSSGAIFSTGVNGAAFSGTVITDSPIFLWDPNRYALKAGSAAAGWSVGSYSTSLGQGVATGWCAFAQGSSRSSGYFAFSGGLSTTATNTASIALGQSTNATGNASVALGSSTTAAGDTSLAANYSTLAAGQYSTSFGQGTRVTAKSAFVIGAYNADVSAANGSTNWNQTDSIFEIGAGSTATARSNSLTAFKNGNLSVAGRVDAKGGLRTTRMGDISMGTFTASPTGLADPASLNATIGLRY